MADSQPLVSVITPTYNRARDYLAETIESVLAQDYPDFEYIVLDDGSTDNTRELVARYDDPRLDYHYHDNMGVVRTVNKGFTLAQGEFITVVNSDDPLLPNCLSESVSFLQAHPHALGSYPDWVMIDAQSQPRRYVQVPEYDLIDALSNYICHPGPGTMLRRRVFELVGLYDPDFKSVFDMEFYMRVGMKGPLMRLPKTLATYREHGTTITKDQRGATERFQMLDKLYSLPEMPDAGHRVKKNAYASAHYVTGVMDVANRRRAAYHFLQSIRLCPVGCRPMGLPRRWWFIIYIISSAVLPKFLRRPLGKIKVALTGS